MDVIILLVFISIVLVVGALCFFVWIVKIGTFEHSDRLALLPLLDDANEVEKRRSVSPASAALPVASGVGVLGNGREL